MIKALLLGLLNFRLLLMVQQHTPLPHGMVFGQRFEVVNMQKTADLETFMGNQTRTSVVLIGRVLKVTNPRAGQFQLDAGPGKVLNARFKNYGVTLPEDLKGREVIISGIAAKQFSSDGRVHQPADNSKHKPIELEVTGLYVNR